MIRIVPYDIIKKIFDGMQLENIEEWRQPEMLSELRRMVLLPVNLARSTPSIIKIESILDFGKVQFILSHPKKKISQVQYWKGSKGSWVWHEDRIRFIQNFRYEDLAVNTFITFMEQMKQPLDLLRFDVEDMNNWIQGRIHSTKFYEKIRNWARTRQQFKVRRFYMKIMDRRKHPFEIGFLRSRILEEITIRMWDDGRLDNLREIDQLESWRLAKCLNLADKKLSNWHPNIQGCKVFWMWQVTMEDFYRIRDLLSANLTPNRSLTIISRCPFNRNEFITALKADYYGVVEYTPPKKNNPRGLDMIITIYSDNEIDFKVKPLA